MTNPQQLEQNAFPHWLPVTSSAQGWQLSGGLRSGELREGYPAARAPVAHIWTPGRQAEGPVGTSFPTAIGDGWGQGGSCCSPEAPITGQGRKETPRPREFPPPSLQNP